MTSRSHPVLYVIGCGARPCGQLPEFVTWAQGLGWEACVILTPKGVEFADVPKLEELTGYPVRSEYKRPTEPDVLPWPADAFVVAPATFNTINKWAAGISDTLALGLLNEGLGLEVPMIAVPNPNVILARHPAFQRSVQDLRSWGVRVMFDPERYPLPKSVPGASPTSLFPWPALRDEFANAARGMQG
ncbi:flavoprotein [[Actinomadura] parvosata]|uniref:flavoprotein n=1 Tax=[Actinomadura] parvosata TaxID=1955412 RepID=UPI0012BD5D84|nr:flavoprotein [Nonomuraea sp. ATCC 55076]